MVATVRPRKRSAAKRSSRKKASDWKNRIILLAAIVIAVLFGTLIWQLQSAQSRMERGAPAAAGAPARAEAPKKQAGQDPDFRYHYTEILENRSVDTGSGVTVTRNYEAEKIARENARRQELAEKKKLEEEKRRLDREKARLAEEKRRFAEEKRQAALKGAKAPAPAAAASAPAARDSAPARTDAAAGIRVVEQLYVECASNVFRTAKEAEAQKAKLALGNGKNPAVLRKKIGGGYAFALRTGPYAARADAEKARADIIRAGLGSNCSFTR